MKTMLVTVDSLFTNFGTYGAVDGARFRNLLLGRQALYQLSYYRIICLPACQPRFTERQSASFCFTFDLRGRIGMNNVNYPRWRQEWDLDPRTTFVITGVRVQRIKPSSAILPFKH